MFSSKNKLTEIIQSQVYFYKHIYIYISIINLYVIHLPTYIHTKKNTERDSPTDGERKRERETVAEETDW